MSPLNRQAAQGAEQVRNWAKVPQVIGGGAVLTSTRSGQRGTTEPHCHTAVPTSVQGQGFSLIHARVPVTAPVLGTQRVLNKW